jgi:hypothetical protein
MRKYLALATILAAMVAAPPGHAEVLVPASKAIDNDQVTVWDVILKPGQHGPLSPKDQDAVVLYLEGGTIETEGPTGKSTTTRAFGDAVFIPKGSNVRDLLVKGGPAHQVVVWLKDAKPKTIANSTKYPTAWPRPGAVKALENDRVIAWNYSWIKGRPAPMHFHIHQQVVAERFDGTIKTIEPDGKTTIGPTKAGEIRFTEPNRLHSEEWDSGKVSAVVLELK